MQRQKQIKKERDAATGELFGLMLYAFLFNEDVSKDIDRWHRKHLPNGDKREYMPNWVLGA